jgi:hypothetical protein
MRTPAHYGHLPLSFEPNRGQAASRIRFISHDNGATLFLTSTDAVLALARFDPPIGKDFAKSAVSNERAHGMRALPGSGMNTKVEALALRMKFEGADTSARAEGMGLLPGISNYLIGNDPHAWHTGIPNYAKVRYRNLYPGIDLIFTTATRAMLNTIWSLPPDLTPGPFGCSSMAPTA